MRLPLSFVLYGCLILLGLLLLIMALACFAAASRERLDYREAAPAGVHWVKAGDVDIAYQEAGPRNGPAVLFIPGTAAWSETWRPAMTALAAHGYRAIAIDLPPFGYSQRPGNGDYSTVAQAQRIVGALDALGVRQTMLVGHSVGARATVEAAMSVPERVASLVLVDAALGLQSSEAPSSVVRGALDTPPLRNALIASTATNPWLTRYFLAQFTSRHEVLTPETVARYSRPFVQRGTTAAFGRWADSFILQDRPPASAVAANYRRLTMPALVLWGRTDAVTPLAQGQYLSGLLPNVRLSVLDGVGHIPQLESPAQFNNALLAYLMSAGVESEMSLKKR